MKKEIDNSDYVYSECAYDVHTHMHDDVFVNEGSEKDKEKSMTFEMRMENLKNNKIKIITIGTDINESRKARDLADKYENVYFTCGLHPHDNLNEEFDEEEFEKLVIHKKCVAVGECGLDYFYLEKDKESGAIENMDREVDGQRDIFIKQIQFAKKHNKPLMIHGRPSTKDENDNPTGMDAYEDMLFILEKNYESVINVSDDNGGAEGATIREEKNKLQEGGNIKQETESNAFYKSKKSAGNVHFFVGDKNIADRFLKLGFTFSFGGVITITNEYDDTLKYIGVQHIHAETDSPYVVPKDKNGKRVSKINSSENINIIIEKIAEIKNIKVEDLKIELEKNFKRDFL